MPEYLSPGVYVEEVQTGPRPIEGVGTSTAGFVGQTERGPESPRLIGGWLEFQRWYGGHDSNRSWLSYAVQGFFDNGGQRCFVTRVVPSDVTEAKAATVAVGGLSIFAYGRGGWGNRIRLVIRNATSKPDKRFRVTVFYYKDPAYFDPANFVNPLDTSAAARTDNRRRNPDVLEDYDDLELDTTSSRNIATIINANSKIIRASFDEAGGPPTKSDDVNTLIIPINGADGGTTQLFANYQGKRDDPVLPNVADGSLLGRGWGLEALDIVDAVALLLAPDEVRSGLGELRGDVIRRCETLKDRFGVLSASQGMSDVGAVQTERTNFDTTYAAYYYPWIEVFDPTVNRTLLVPPAGHVAGIMARTDIERGVHKAPANEVVRGARNLEFPITKQVQDILNPVGVNCIRDFRNDRRGIRLWGARTMSSDGMWKYVNVRRLFIFVEESIDEGTQFVVFEPNDEPTWAAVRRTITNFLVRVWRDGALMGSTQEEAFFVKCDRTTMTQDDIDNGRLICYIGIAPVKPAEFVIFRISQKTADAEA